jgi:hypothetical protein
MTCVPPFLRRLPARRLLASAVVLACAGTAAQQDAAQFPAAAIRFLDAELPRMEVAVAERDRDYFEEAMGRMVAFSEDWGFKSHANPALARYAGCTDAVADFAIVGLCRLMPNGDVCEPALAPRFDANLRQCREAAR